MQVGKEREKGGVKRKAWTLIKKGGRAGQTCRRQGGETADVQEITKMEVYRFGHLPILSLVGLPPWRNMISRPKSRASCSLETLCRKTLEAYPFYSYILIPRTNLNHGLIDKRLPSWCIDLPRCLSRLKYGKLRNCHKLSSIWRKSRCAHWEIKSISLMTPLTNVYQCIRRGI